LLGVLALLVFGWERNKPHFLIMTLIISIGTFSFLGGAAAVAFYDIWAKVIPSNLRGRFFAFRQLGGGILAVGAGILVKIILSSRRFIFPTNYALLSLLSFLFISISYLALGSVKEPEEKEVRPPLKFSVYLRRVMEILKSDSNLRRFL